MTLKRPVLSISSIFTILFFLALILTSGVRERALSRRTQQELVSMRAELALALFDERTHQVKANLESAGIIALGRGEDLVEMSDRLMVFETSRDVATEVEATSFKLKAIYAECVEPVLLLNPSHRFPPKYAEHRWSWDNSYRLEPNKLIVTCRYARGIAPP
jgi:hypothetical protein